MTRFEHQLTDLEHGVIHSRWVGAGPPLLVLPPGNGVGPLLPLIDAWAAKFHVVMIDIPGYGLSAPLRDERPGIADYAFAIGNFCDRLGVARLGVFGSHTGAAIAAGLAALRPELVVTAILHELSFFSTAQRADYLQNYLPPYRPDAWGTHLLQAWHRYREQLLFRPWHRPSASTRRLSPADDLAALHETFLLQVAAGDGYRKCYEAVLRNDLVGTLCRVRVPCQIVASERRWFEGAEAVPDVSPVLVQPNLIAEHCVAAFVEALAPLPPLERPTSHNRMLQTVGHHVVPVSELGPDAGDVPFVIVPDLPGPSSTASGLARALAGGGERVVLPEVAGNGGCILASDGERPSIEDQIRVARALLDRLGIERCHLVGVGLGSVIAAALAGRHQGVASLSLVNPPILSTADRERLIERYPHEIEIHWSGRHLIELWQVLRNESLFWPRFDFSAAAALEAAPPDPVLLDRRVIGILRHPRHYATSQRDLLAVDLDKHVAAATVPVRMFQQRDRSFSAVMHAPYAAAKLALCGKAADDAQMAELLKTATRVARTS